MATILIGYDLNKTGQDYKDLIDAIEATFGTRWHCLDSTWIVKSELTPETIANRLKVHIDSNDELLVIKVTREAAWVGFNDECSTWLKNNL